MIVKTFETEEEWMNNRRGKITGSRMKDIVVKRGTGEKAGYYELIAERLAQPKDDENAMERGHRLEEEAIHKFSQEYGIVGIDTTLVIWERRDNKSIAISPDGFIPTPNGIKTAIEIKCLSSAKHIEAVITDEIPDEYEYQKLQYFIVNDELETLWFVMYDPRMPEKLQLKVFEVKREEIAGDIAFYKKYQEEKLAKIDEIVNQLTF